MDGRVCGALSLSRAFGDYQFKGEKGQKFLVSNIPEVNVIDLHGLESVLIACDGIWEGLENYGKDIMK